MRALIAIVFVALLGAGEAAAASCSALRAQLAAAQSGGGSAKLRQQYAAYGCSSSSAWGRHRACGGLERQMSGGGASSRQIRALQSQVAAACATETRSAARREAPAVSNGGRSRMIGGRVVAAAPGETVDERGGFFDNLFGGRRRDDMVREARVTPRASTTTVERLDMEEARGRRKTRSADDEGGGGAGEGVDIAAVAKESGGKKLREGNLQTVCVRLCDGFYFPVNDRSHSANFYEELAMCVGRCPGADVSLYSHGSGTPVESMRSTLSNERYTDLPTAFDYRKGLTDDCSCQTRTVIAGSLDSGRTLGYVGLARRRATTVADAAAEPGAMVRAWRPLRAVLDETGEPLRPSWTARTVVDGRIRASLSPSAPVVASAPPRPVALAAERPETLRLREVGPQFFSDTNIAEDVERRRRPAQVVRTTAVRVVPLAPGATVAPSATGEPAALEIGTNAAAAEPAAPGADPADAPARELDAAAAAADPATGAAVDMSALPISTGGRRARSPPPPRRRTSARPPLRRRGRRSRGRGGRRPPRGREGGSAPPSPAPPSAPSGRRAAA